MQQVPKIQAAYNWMIKTYGREVARAMASGNMAALLHLNDTRDAIERGIFVLLFGQFEKVVTEHFENARDHRGSNADWNSR